MPTRWYAGGRGLDNFRDEMLNDIHISQLHDFLKPELIFQNINLRGGICYFLRDKNYDNIKKLSNVYTYKDSLIPTSYLRSLKTEGTDILIRHSIAIKILGKIKSDSGFISFENYISSLRPFGFRGYFTNNSFLKIFSFAGCSFYIYVTDNSYLYIFVFILVLTLFSLSVY